MRVLLPALRFVAFAVTMIAAAIMTTTAANADPLELRDPDICTSREKDFQPPKPQPPPQPAHCTAYRSSSGNHASLGYTLSAKERPVSIVRVGANGASSETFRLLNAYTYLADPAHPDEGTVVPPVLRMDRGDTLKIHLENELPPVDGMPQPTNLHTHGLVVSPRGNSDNVFIQINPKGAVNPPQHPGMDVKNGAFDYAINVPRERINMPGNNPSQSRAGLFWFHPHIHGLAQRQLSHGLSGLLSVGSVGEYADCLGATGYPVNCDTVKRHFVMLRDFIVEEAQGGWKIIERGDAEPVFCAVDLAGNCPDEADKPKRKWLFTVNGAVKPMLHMQAGETRLFRLGNVGADVTYKLDAVALDGSTSKPKVQLIAKDGIGVAGNDPLPLLLMPASRVEFMLSVPPGGGHWMIRTLGHDTGGDAWPAADLIEISAPAVVAAARAAKPASVSDVSMKEPLKKIDVEMRPLSPELTKKPEAPPQPVAAEVVAPPPGAAADPHAGHRGMAAPVSGPDPCAYKRLKGEQRRVITFAQEETASSKAFKLGYAVSEPGKPPVYLIDPRVAEMGRTDVCVGVGAEETWEIVNTADEIHNFHIHQSKYMVAGVTVEKGTDCNYVNLPPGPGGDHATTCNIDGVAGAAGHDTFPIPPHGRLTIRIAFKNAVQRGKFVFHCHLLEHEDNGMMSVLELKE